MVEIDGGWHVLRIVLSIVFTVALVAWLTAFVRERRARPSY